jgi:hypothetical protein
MKKIICLLIVLLLEGCVTLRDTRPDLNRNFRLGQDTPGEYPYCRLYNEESELHVQMYGP